MSSVDAALKKAEDAYNAAKEREASWIEKLANAAAIGDKNYERISKQAETAGNETENALKDLEAARQTAENQKAVIAAGTNQELVELGKAVIESNNTAIKDLANDVISKVGEQSGAAAQAKAGIQAALVDGEVTNAEIPKLLSDLQVMAGTMKGVMTETTTQTQQLIALVRSQDSQIRQNAQEIADLRRQLQNRGPGTP